MLSNAAIELIVDVNMMWLPRNFFTNKKVLNTFMRSVPTGYGIYAKMGTVPGTKRPQMMILSPNGYENLNYTEMFTDPLHRIRVMDEAGVDKALLRLPCWEEWISLETSKMVNDLMAKYVSEHSDRLMGLAVAPPWGDEESLDELDRAVKDLHLSGVEIAAHYGNLYLDEEQFRPFFKKLNQLNVPVCIHHSPLPVEYNSLYKFSNIRRSFGRIIDQMISLGRILHSGMLDQFPNLKLIPTQMGGGLFAFTNQMKGQRSTVKEDVQRFDMVGDKIERYLNRNIFYDITFPTLWSKAQLECAVKELRADHMLFGGSYPVMREWLLKGVQAINNLEISDREKKLILGGNAMRLFKIKA